VRHTILCALILVFAASAAPAQESANTRVYLMDGTVVMGELVEKSADLIILRDTEGEIFTFEPEQIDKLVTLESLGSQARTVTVREFPYISFLGGTVALGLISWLQFDTAGDRDSEADINAENGLTARAGELRDKADRARLWGWSTAILATGSLGVALIPKTRTKRIFPELSVVGGDPRLQLVMRHRF
jgi:hypothetical protein